ncbi:MAG: transglutaminase family protein [Candidatus Omnitrophota bacterium]
MADNIICEKFKEWTKDLAPKEARIAVFERIRDIPYAIVPKLRDHFSGPAGMLELNKGSCQPKHYLLAQFFEKLGIPIQLATYVFRWQDCPVAYPSKIKQLVEQLPVGYHLACKAYIEKKWVLVDATWDKPLKAYGFSVNEHWDGLSATENAVVVLEEITHKDAADRCSYETQKRSGYSDNEKALYTEFIEQFNQWLEQIRRS